MDVRIHALFTANDRLDESGRVDRTEIVYPGEASLDTAVITYAYGENGEITSSLYHPARYGDDVMSQFEYAPDGRLAMQRIINDQHTQSLYLDSSLYRIERWVSTYYGRFLLLRYTSDETTRRYRYDAQGRLTLICRGDMDPGNPTPDDCFSYDVDSGMVLIRHLRNAYRSVGIETCGQTQLCYPSSPLGTDIIRVNDRGLPVRMEHYGTVELFEYEYY